MSEQKILEFRERAERLVAPADLSLLQQRGRALRRRRQLAPILALAVCGVIGLLAATTLFGGRGVSAPERVHPVGPARIGGPPLTPFWHDGVLHVRGIEIKSSTPIGSIEVAGDTVLVSPSSRGKSPAWALVRGDRLAPLPASRHTTVRLSLDGRIAFWQGHPTVDSTRFVAWDTETNRELASRDLPRRDHADAGPRLYLAGIDANGKIYWVDEASEVVVKRWDVRADTVEPVPNVSATDLTYAEGEFNRDQYLSPDGTREVFTRDPAGDPVTDCWPACKIQLRVRPVAPGDTGEVVRLRLPEGTLYEHLWDPRTDIGGRHMDAWWETNETVLVQVTHDSNLTDLVRCSIKDGACEHVFELGTDRSWWRNWSFARFPTG